MWRNQGMHNDDSSLVIIKQDGSDNFNLDAIDDIDDLIKDEQTKEKSQVENAITPNVKISKEEGIREFTSEAETATESSSYATFLYKLNCLETEKKMRQCIRNMLYGTKRGKNNIRQCHNRQKPKCTDKLLWEAIKKQFLDLIK